MIETDSNVAYDTTGHYYYLTMVGAEALSGYDDLATVKTERDLKRQARQLHRALTRSAYNGKPNRYRHKDIIEYMIFKNENGERQAVIDMLVEMVVWDYEENGTLKVYEDKYVDSGVNRLPQSILEYGIEANIYFTGEIFYEVPEDEYRVGY